jgi:hypothetical protein
MALLSCLEFIKKVIAAACSTDWNTLTRRQFETICVLLHLVTYMMDNTRTIEYHGRSLTKQVTGRL